MKTIYFPAAGRNGTAPKIPKAVKESAQSAFGRLTVAVSIHRLHEGALEPAVLVPPLADVRVH